jgi:hypothetical protein
LQSHELKPEAREDAGSDHIGDDDGEGSGWGKVRLHDHRLIEFVLKLSSGSF